MSILDTFQQPLVVDQSAEDALDLVALKTIEHLRLSGITTAVGVGRVLDRAMDLMMRSRSKPLPQTGPKRNLAGEVNALGDCPRCGTGGLTFREDRRNRSSSGAGVTRIFLACATPHCGYVES